ncbi:Protein CBG26972 [Caenorhabditis briggsae]|uniref:Protein CBG26972 n=1 Tax=Caenorhabditis briggsae TaxID=6238 RepID=B6IET8_CAEBR|nr:Protein CBG26972 [Caenorhabditis briggsae]CAR98418.1 Protein CBG26972 [Caenorhabditis briggsae]
MYKFQVDEQCRYPFMFVDGCMALFVRFSYVILASALVGAICKAEKRRRNLGNDESSNASKLITIMAISVFISETTYGALYVVTYFFDRQYEEIKVIKRQDSIVLIFLIINSATHSIICFFMSSQYRETARRLFWKRSSRVGNIISSVPISS